MYNPELIEIIAEAKQAERLKDAEIARLLKENKKGGSSTTLKLAVVASGTALAALIIVQMVAI